MSAISTASSRAQVATDRVAAGLTTLSDLSPAMLARLRARFDAKTTPEPTSGCILWTGALTSQGYGCIGIGSRGHSTAIVRAAHRVAWLLDNGDLPADVVCDHKCRNRACVNSLHLEPVSHGENMRRGVRSRREARAALELARLEVASARLAEVTP